LYIHEFGCWSGLIRPNDVAVLLSSIALTRAGMSNDSYTLLTARNCPHHELHKFWDREKYVPAMLPDIYMDANQSSEDPFNGMQVKTLCLGSSVER
jgi:hypothetical protein